jgi:hypothetical protein
MLIYEVRILDIPLSVLCAPLRALRETKLLLVTAIISRKVHKEFAKCAVQIVFISESRIGAK